MRKILVIEDNRDIAELAALHLRDLDAEIDIAYDGATGDRLLQAHPYELIVLDLMLPEVDGLELCRRIRARDAYTPVLMLTAKTTELDRVLGLEMGADDYLTKPFSVRELVARVKALFRRVDALQARPAQNEEESLQVGPLRLEGHKREVKRDDRQLALTAKEFDLLWHFARHPGQVFSRAQLLDTVWGYGHDGYEHTVNSHINRLRAKIEEDPAHPHYILTVWGVGYKFSEQAV